MTSTQQKGLSPNRVCGPPGANIVDLECPVCHDLLWKPVACQTCETPFCSACINQCLSGSTKCPSGCKVYIERKCPPFVAKLLAQLQISCFYQSKGCQQVFSYEALDKHELECGYQSERCSDCQLIMMKKDLAIHKRTCAAMKLTCEGCKIVYRRGGSGRKHTENICLREQLRQLRQEFEENKAKLELLMNQLNNMTTSKIRISQEVMITFDDLPSAAEETKWVPDAYKGLKWSKIVYMERSYAGETYPNSGYISAFMSTSSPHIAFINEEASISTEEPNETFTLVSFAACAAWTENLHLTVIGYRNSIQINTHTAILLFGKPQVILLLWKNIDKIVFQPSGGSAHPENGQIPSDTHCVLTQLTIDQLS